MASNTISYFAWVNQTDTTWNSAFARNDENVFHWELGCDEGQIPKLSIEVKNPRVGPLAPGRLYWAWFTVSTDGGVTFTPMFFGRLIGLPQSMLYNTVRYEFIARRGDYIRQKQLVAETLKVQPNYDSIFLDVQKRDDPDAILEGYSALYAVDRVTGAVSVSDILIGEDGTISVAAADTFYDSVQMKLMQSPLVAVNVKAEVSWEQQYTGYFYIGQWSYPTLGTEPFVNDWPKTGQNVGGGYSGAVSWAGIKDPLNLVSQTSNINEWIHYQNPYKRHNTGDLMTHDSQSSLPVGMSLIQTTHFNQPGLLVPFAVDNQGYPDPVNTPAITRDTYFGIATFALGYANITAVAALGLRYDANRKRNEQIEITVQADVQPILIDPLVTEDTETISIKSGDLSLPTINYLNWSAISGLPVTLGTFIFPDNPLVAGQTSSQICISAGTAGLIEPTFSNIAGVTTNDGSVVWSSLGSTPPVENSQDWVQTCRVSLGTLIIPRPVAGCPDMAAILATGSLGPGAQGTPEAKYAVIAGTLGQPGDTMYQVTQAGIVGGSAAAQATLQTFIQPSGQSLYICVQAGITGAFHTTFNDTPGALTSDGSVVWQCIGLVTVPIGGWPGATPASSYFPTTRGNVSVEHLICRAVAKLRRRARAVQVTFQCRLEAVLAITCRMNVGITDPRLPGGVAAGKVVSYKLKRDGDSGKSWAEVTIGCSIGGTNSVHTSVAGTATYVDNYFNPGDWEVWANQINVVNGTANSVGYTVPVTTVVDDGLTFPLNGATDVILENTWHGTPSTLNPANIQAYNNLIQKTTSDAIAAAQARQGGITTTNATSIENAILQAVYQGSYLWYELSLKPLQGGPYAAAYVIDTTLLMIPQTINLSAS